MIIGNNTIFRKESKYSLKQILSGSVKTLNLREI